MYNVCSMCRCMSVYVSDFFWTLNYDIWWDYCDYYGDVDVMVSCFGVCLPEWTTEGQHCCAKIKVSPAAGERHQPEEPSPRLAPSNEPHGNDLGYKA